MPVYQCVARQGSVKLEQRRALAAELTRIHCDATGAAREFVDVLFLEVPEEDGFTAGGPLQTSRITGYIRAGRTPEVRARIMREITDRWVAITGEAAADVVVTLVDIPAAWVMKGGVVLPEPGEDAEWLARAGS